MQKTFAYDIYHGVIILAPLKWDTPETPEKIHRQQGFFRHRDAVEFFTPHADDTVSVTLAVTDRYPSMADNTLRAIRVPLEVGPDLMLCNIDREDDLPLESVPPGRYGVQFELRPSIERDGKQYYYDIRLTFVPDIDQKCEILKSGHEGMTATEVLQAD